MNSERRRQLIGYVAAMPLFAIFIYVIAFAPKRSGGDGQVAADVVADSADGEVLSAEFSFAPFDPNEASYRTLVESGVPRNIAVGIIRWRESGKVYRIKEDVALVYGMTDSLYYELEPYINIGEQYRPIKHEQYVSDGGNVKRDKRRDVEVELVPFTLDTVGVAYLRTLGFSHRQASLVVDYREMIGGYRCFEEFEECYGVDSAMAVRLKDYIIFPEGAGREVVKHPKIVEINSADSTTLVSLSGIGEGSVMHILRYRDLLGGYYSPTQILELEAVTTDNFYKFSSQIWCDSAKIKKININFAAPSEMMTHPYLTSRMLKRIVNTRELKGGWSTIEEMIKDKIFSKDEANRIAPYLDFGTQAE